MSYWLINSCLLNHFSLIRNNHKRYLSSPPHLILTSIILEYSLEPRQFLQGAQSQKSTLSPMTHCFLYGLPPEKTNTEYTVFYDTSRVVIFINIKKIDHEYL